MFGLFDVGLHHLQSREQRLSSLGRTLLEIELSLRIAIDDAERGKRIDQRRALDIDVFHLTVLKRNHRATEGYAILLRIDLGMSLPRLFLEVIAIVQQQS